MSRAIDLARETWLNSETDDYLALIVSKAITELTLDFASRVC